ncbi:MAG: FAD-dependent monooxygenase, partial [Gemmatimonadales bacterium]|nr:FAD-dependent monooxygenase [Gemmatimonadales bacterium]
MSGFSPSPRPSTSERNMVHPAEERVDVAIIGGGPGGSSAATMLARAGKRVGVFGRGRFPRFHIGG